MSCGQSGSNPDFGDYFPVGGDSGPMIEKVHRRRILAGMNWRRVSCRLLIHLTVAAEVIVRTEADYWPNIRSERVRVLPSYHRQQQQRKRRSPTSSRVTKGA